MNAKTTATKKRKPATKPAATAAALLVGLTLVDNEVHELHLLPGTFKGPWAKAVEWAKKQGGELPSRLDLLVLWQRAPKEFEREWYWSSEQYAGHVASAWCQSFYHGGQDYYHKSSEFRARAVRRLKI